MSGMFDLSGKTAVVTGASSGIGRALARGFAEAGAGVVASGRRRENLAELIGQIESAGGQGLVVAGDLGREADRDDLIERGLAWGSGIDILINCAGINLRSRAENLSADDWRAVLELDLTVPFLLSQAVSRAMIERGSGGSIINIASLCCTATRPEISAYTAAKGGLALLTKALAVEWARYNIRVNAIGPGYIHTEMTQVLIDDPKFKEWVIQRTPTGRWGEPGDIVGPAIMLASQAGAFVTGQILYVDGGFLASL